MSADIKKVIVGVVVALVLYHFYMMSKSKDGEQ